MNRLDRLFSLVLLLQMRRRIRADDLATELGVSRRTVYRDVAALAQAGIPVASLPGQGYELMEGFFLPPVRFTVEEASALVLGARLLAAQGGRSMAAGTRSAESKIRALLGGAVRERVDAVSGAIEFAATPAGFDLEAPHVDELQQAIDRRRVVRLRYHSRSRQATTERDVEPERLTYGEGAWYLTGYCRLRAGTRDFRLSRIEQLTVLAETFEARPRDPAPPAGQAGAPIEVRLQVRSHVLRWLRERQHYALVREEAADSGTDEDRVFTYHVDALSEIVPWTRSWGADVTVLSPPELRHSMRDDARRVAKALR